jgi:uncharacterized membrane protein YebE (DUF533 family)
MISSNYYLVKAMIALSWADGKQTDDEIALLHKLIENSKLLNDTERAELKSMMREPLDIHQIWDSLTEATHRAAVIDLALSMFHADSDYSDNERQLYEALFKNHLATLPTQDIEADISKMAAEARERLKREEEEYFTSMRDNSHWSSVPVIGRPLGSIVSRIEVLLYRLNH